MLERNSATTNTGTDTATLSIDFISDGRHGKKEVSVPIIYDDIHSGTFISDCKDG